MKEYESNWEILKAIAIVFGVLITAFYLAHPILVAIETVVQTFERGQP